MYTYAGTHGSDCLEGWGMTFRSWISPILCTWGLHQLSGLVGSTFMYWAISLAWNNGFLLDLLRFMILNSCHYFHVFKFVSDLISKHRSPSHLGQIRRLQNTTYFLNSKTQLIKNSTLAFHFVSSQRILCSPGFELMTITSAFWMLGWHLQHAQNILQYTHPENASIIHLFPT